MIDLKINQEPNNFSSFNGIDEAFLPIFISKYLFYQLLPSTNFGFLLAKSLY